MGLVGVRLAGVIGVIGLIRLIRCHSELFAQPHLFGGLVEADGQGRVWAGTGGHQGAPCAVWGKNPGIGVAMSAGWRDQGGQTIQKLHGCQLDVIATPNIARWQLVDQMLVVNASQAARCESWSRAVSEQSLQTEAVIGGGDHGAINGKPAVALPCQHLGGVPFVEEIVSHEIAEDTSANHLSEGLEGEGLEAKVVELGGLKEDEAAVIVWCEGAGRDDDVEVGMSVQAGTASVGEDDSSEAGISWGSRAGFANSGRKRAEKDSLDSTFVLGILEREANAFGDGQHHLPEWDKGKHVVDEMSGGLGHVFGIATRT